MHKIEKLETDRLILRKYKKSDLKDYIEWQSQADYHEFLPTKVKTKEEYKTSFYSSIENYDNVNNPNLTWGVELKQEKKLIGSINISKISSTHKCAEIGWGLNPKYQKKGYAYESVQCFLDYLCNSLGINKVSALIWEGNEPSIKLATKLGFVLEGRERQARIKNGKFIDVLHFGILKKEYELKNNIKEK